MHMDRWSSIDKGLTEKPELVFALAAPVGTPLEPIQDAAQEELDKRGYACETVRLSSILADCLELGLPVPSGSCSELERIMRLMDLGDRLRQVAGRGDALAVLAIARIVESRGGRKPQPGRAYIIRQLKHPDEVVRFTRTYESAFQLISVYCPEQVRRANLVRQGMSEADAQMLIERDSSGGHPYAQQLRDTFCMGDVFIRVTQDDEDAFASATDPCHNCAKHIVGAGIRRVVYVEPCFLVHVLMELG